ncbi:FUSC family protein [[Clostridium] dakarense]|uniref:FUSC family protein n=1 Tax=Faecalimicrobium dakarense TaxID=1301100 RepID=UPI00137727C7|nr:FUSC family protein [[Clostridium] dakarense]
MKRSKKELVSLILSKTLIFMVIVLLVSIFKSIFKPENSLIGVTSIVLMLVLLQMDLTINPIKNLFGLIGLNLILGLSAFLVSQNVLLGLILNFAIMAFIGYYFSYELKNPINMMIGLHYILMIANPITLSQLPLRLLSLVAGVFMIMAVQLLANKNKLIKSRKKMINGILDAILLKVDLLKSNKDTIQVDDALTMYINQLKSTIFDSGKSESHLTECGRNTISILSCLEKINVILSNMKDKDIDSEFLDSISKVIKDIKDKNHDINVSYLEDKYKESNLYLLDIEDVIDKYDFINTIKVLNIEMRGYDEVPNKQKDIQNELSIPQEFKSLHVQKRLINLKSTRVAYGIRLGLVVALTFFFVDFFNIQYGEWAVYTVFALSQPHSEYTIYKSKKRIIGTVIGAVIIAILFNLITDTEIRTIMLIAAGYLMSYMSDYRDLVIFVTISSIASAALYVVNPNFIIINRVVFVVIGIAISLIANKFVFSRKLSDEKENLNNIQEQASKNMIEEVLFNEGNKNASVIGILSLVPSLIDLRIDYLKQNGLNMDKAFINRNKILVNDLYQIYLLEKYSVDYNNALAIIKKSADTSSSVDVMESKIAKAIKTTNNFKEKFLLAKVSKILRDITNSGYSEKKSN